MFGAFFGGTRFSDSSICCLLTTVYSRGFDGFSYNNTVVTLSHFLLISLEDPLLVICLAFVIVSSAGHHFTKSLSHHRRKQSSL